jgi:hypothetical protein
VPTLWIAVLHISPWVRQKLIARHRLDPDALRRRLVGRSVGFTWDLDPGYGLRALVRLPEPRGRHLLVVLYPTGDPGAWDLASAHLVRGSKRWENRQRD